MSVSTNSQRCVIRTVLHSHLANTDLPVLILFKMLAKWEDTVRKGWTFTAVSNYLYIILCSHFKTKIHPITFQ